MDKTILRSVLAKSQSTVVFPLAKNPSKIEKSESILPNGYYTMASVQRLCSILRSRAEWEGVENWAAESVSRVARNLYIKVVMNNLDGEVRLNVLAGKIAAFETDANAMWNCSVKCAQGIGKGTSFCFYFYTLR